jgi:Restriction endonuclease
MYVVAYVSHKAGNYFLNTRTAVGRRPSFWPNDSSSPRQFLLPTEIAALLKLSKAGEAERNQLREALRSFCGPLIVQRVAEIPVDKRTHMLSRLDEYVMTNRIVIDMDDALFYLPKWSAQRLGFETTISTPTLILSREIGEGLDVFSAISPSFVLEYHDAEQLFLESLFLDSVLLNRKEMFQYLGNDQYGGSLSDRLAKIISHAPASRNTVQAIQFTESIPEHVTKELGGSVFEEYLSSLAETCLHELESTDDVELVDLILKYCIQTKFWLNGMTVCREAAFDRLARPCQTNVAKKLIDYVSRVATYGYPSDSELADRLRDLVVPSQEMIVLSDQKVQLRIANLQSAYLCAAKLLDEDDESQHEAIEYALARKSELMTSVDGEPAKALKKLPSWIKKGEMRSVAAVLNEVMDDESEWLEDAKVFDMYCQIIFSMGTDPKWLELCETLPVMKSRLSVREGLARHYIARGEASKAQLHVRAIEDFEPGSELCLELGQLLSRAVAIERLTADFGEAVDIDTLSGVDFERVLIAKLQSFGFLVKDTPATGDYGADIVADDYDGTRYVVQCKRFGSRVNLKAVQEIVGAMKHYGADYTIVATNNEFLNSAIELAKSNGVELWNGTDVLKVLSGDIGFSVLGSANFGKRQSVVVSISP